jgi:hypothetical protein
MKPLNDAAIDLRRDAPRNRRFPLIKRIYLFMHFDVCPVVPYQFDNRGRNNSA